MAKRDNINDMPHVSTPDSLTNQNMWAFFFTEIQRIHTERLNPIRELAFSFDSKALLPYRSVLKTLTQMFAGFLYKDFNDERKKINNLFDQFQTNYNRAEELKKSPNPKMVSDELNDLYNKCLKSLELIDNMLEVIRQKKGFGVTEQVSFVINERASKALRVNNDISKELLKMFKKKEKKKKEDSTIKEINQEVEELLEQEAE